MGSPEFALKPLENLIFNGYEIPAVYTQPDQPSGRGLRLHPPPVKKLAEYWKIPVRQAEPLNSEEEIRYLVSLEPDVIVVAAFGQILSRTVLGIPRLGCINLHPSLLPRFRGPSPVASAILAGDEFSGTSIMQMDERMDTGPVYARAQIPVSESDNAGSLAEKLSLISAQMLLSVLPLVRCGGIAPCPQDDALVSYSRVINKRDGEIEWGLPAVDIWRRVRAFNPWPVCFTKWSGRKLRVIEAVPIDERGYDVGVVTALKMEQQEKGAAFGVGTGKGVLGLLLVQLEGKKAMRSEEFLRGHRSIIGARLG